MIPHYLNATDEAALYQALEEAGIVAKTYTEFDEEGNPTGEPVYATQPGYDLDIIGVIYKPTGETDEEGNPIMVPEEGFHANVRSWDYDLTPEQLAVLPTIPTPANPVRGWC